MTIKTARLNTKLVHAGEPRPGIEGAVVLPVFQSSTYEFTGAESYHDIKYMRLNNTPNHIALQKKLAAVESAEAALVTASGMAAISTTLLTILSSGRFKDYPSFLVSRIGNPTDHVMRFLIPFLRHDDNVDGHPKTAKGVPDPYALFSRICGIRFEGKKINVAIPGHLSLRSRTEDDDFHRPRNSLYATHNLFDKAIVNGHSDIQKRI